MKTLMIITMVLLIFPFFTNGQDILFSQPNEAPIILNPANAGSQYDLRVAANFREQWRSITSPYRTIATSIDGKVLRPSQSGSSLGFGLVVFNDVAGEGNLTTNQVNLCISGKVHLSSSQNLSAGIFGGFVQRRISTNNLSWGNQYNGLNYDETIASDESFSNPNYTNGDFGAGIQWSYGKGASTLSSNDKFGAQAGFAVFHINTPRIGFYEIADELFLRYVFHLSGAYEIKNTNMQVAPLFLFEKQGPAKLIYFGSYVKYSLQKASKYTGNLNSRTIGIGGFLRGGDAAVVAAKCELGQFAFGLSYDINISSLSNVSYGRGGFELSLSYMAASKKSKGNRLL